MFCAVFVADKIVSLQSVLGGKHGWIFPFALYAAVYLLIGYDVLYKAARNICRGRVLDENFLMCVATLGAFTLAIYRGETGREIEGFDEACAVLLFYQVGEWFQSFATGRSRASIASLMDIRPDYANVKRGDAWEKADPNEVQAGEIIMVFPGEKVPLDGVIVAGATALDAKALTGESLPRDAAAGDQVISGCVNLSSQIEVRATKPFYDSTVSKILDLVENAAAQKSKAENFITKFAKYYTPAVVAAALILGIVPALITSDWATWLYRALAFLVVSCPCALVISIPLSFFAGLGAASKHGILVKGSNYLEKLHKADVFVFDKTGTLTKGNFTVTKITPADAREDILRLAATAEQASDHPIARSIVAAYGKAADKGYTLTNIAGAGVEAVRGQDVILCGNETLLRQKGVAYVKEEEAGTVVYVARNGKFVGSLLIADQIKEEAAQVVGELNAMGCRTVMLTGDNAAVARSVARTIGVTDHKAQLLPQDKVEEVQKLLSAQNKNGALCFVGDGINDAPVLMRSDIGVAMGGVGSDAAIEAADVVLMQDDLRGLPLGKRVAKKTMRVVTQNIVFSLVVKAAVLVLSALGIANMWIAVFGDVGVAVLAILNAMRVNGRYDKKPRANGCAKV
ncbi:MAG: cadmium-translocating P-type ATPase [Clostridia bacterium]|nr:cadmium-translocating P-type ATPase [Clostridia bacterium]